MAINVSFNGATIYRPGAYSKTTVDLGGGFPLGVAGLVAIFGEADAGTPGASEADISQNFVTGDTLIAAREKYRSGPIVDALNFLFAPASDAAIPNGASTVWVYKTNASVRATLDLDDSYGTIRAKEWGTGGNRISAEVVSIAETPAVVTGTVNVAGADFALAETLIIYVQGEKVTHTIATSTDPADLLVQLNAAFPGLTFSYSSLKLRITRTVDADANLLGYARNFMIDGASTSLTTFGLAVAASTLQQASVEPSCTITLDNKRDNIQESATLTADVILTVGYNGAETTATVNVEETKITLTAGATERVFVKAGYATISQMIAEINLMAGWGATIGDAAYNNLPLSAIDETGAALGCKGETTDTAWLKMGAWEVNEFFEASTMCDLVDPRGRGIPSALTETSLADGAKGATLSANISTALDKFTKFHVNSIVPLFSRDADDDILDDLTDEDSTYTIDAIHQAVKTHISLMKTTKRRSERQGYLSQKDEYSTCVTKAMNLNDARLQLLIQDVKQVDSAGTIKWFQPWALAAMFAGARGGASVGMPMTFKFFNISGLRHTSDAMTTAEADIVIDFDPDTQYEDAIQSGITFLERAQTGGFRCVVDNTTYGLDDNWVWNRANVVYAADIVAFNMRNRLEQTFVGKKNNVQASTVSSVCASILATFLAQGITVSTTDAPNGYKQLSCRIDGNTIYVSVVVKLVEGIDFVLSDITVQRAQQ
jgi:hypothetical protein